MGKTVRRTPSKVNTEEFYQVPPDILSRYQNLTVAIDIMYFDRILFLLTITRVIHFYTVEKINNCENRTILDCLRKVLNMYQTRGFSVQFILGDDKFRHMKDEVMTEIKCHLNWTAAGEHVPEAEQAIRVIKERARCITSTWKFKWVPILFKTSLIKFVVFWLNSIPQANSIMPNISSKAILIGPLPD